MGGRGGIGTFDPLPVGQLTQITSYRYMSFAPAVEKGGGASM